MTRKEFIKALAEKQGITQLAAEKFLDGAKSIIVAEVSAGNPVTISNTFGAFKPITRSGKAPGTGKPYTSKSVKFSPSAALKRVLN